MGRDVARVAAGDVAGADDADAHGIHAAEPTYAGRARADSIRQRPMPYRQRHASRPDRPPAVHGPPPAGRRTSRERSPPSPRPATGRRAGGHAGRLPADELARHLDDAGLRPSRSHEGMDRLRADPHGGRGAPARCSAARGSSSLDAAGGPGTSVESSAVRRGARARWPRRSSAHGLGLGYHNHDFEFAPIDGTTAFDVLLSELPADDRDSRWTSTGSRSAGCDPVAAIRAAAGPGADAAHEGPGARTRRPATLPVGSGVLDFPGIVDAGRAARVDWYVVELDDPVDEIADIIGGGRVPGVARRLTPESVARVERWTTPGTSRPVATGRPPAPATDGRPRRDRHPRRVLDADRDRDAVPRHPDRERARDQWTSPDRRAVHVGVRRLRHGPRRRGHGRLLVVLGRARDRRPDQRSAGSGSWRRPRWRSCSAGGRRSRRGRRSSTRSAGRSAAPGTSSAARSCSRWPSRSSAPSPSWSCSP